jgi:hypothetical protein
MKNVIQLLKSKMFFVKDYILITIAFAVFFLSPYALRFLDPTAGVFDAGILQSPVVGIFMFCVLLQFVWVIIQVIWPSISEYFKDENGFNADFKNGTIWLRISVSLFIYFSLLLIVAFLSKP